MCNLRARPSWVPEQSIYLQIKYRRRGLFGSKLPWTVFRKRHPYKT